MKKIIGGAIAAIVGLYGVSIFFTSMSSVLIGVIPFILLISGCLIVYLKYKDLKSGKEFSDSHTRIDPSETISTSTEPEEADPKTTEPEEAEPKTAEPEETESKTAVPEDAELKAAEPVEEVIDNKSVESEPMEIKSTKDSADIPIGDNQNLVGNTGSLVFHNPDCQYSKSKKCTAIFNSRELALREGYKPCGVCKP